MQVGHIDGAHAINMSENIQKMAEQVKFSEQNKAMVKENSTDFLFELGAVKVQMHKKDRTEFQKTDTNHHTETFSNLQQSMMEDKKEHNMQVADMSMAQKKVNSLFKPQMAKQHINLIA